MEKNIQTYWKEFSPLWWGEIKLWFGWTDFMNAIIKSGTHILALVVILWLGGNIQNFFESITVQIVEGIIMFLSLYSILFVTYNRASNKLYENQREIQKKKNDEIKTLKDKYELPPLPNQLEITSFNDIASTKRIGIKIDNPTIQRISNIKVELAELKFIKIAPVTEYSLTQYVSETNRLFKSGQGFENGFSIVGLGHAFIFLAEERDGVIVFLLENPQPSDRTTWEWGESEKRIELTRKDHPQYKGQTTAFTLYGVGLVVSGEIDGHPMAGKSFSDWLRFGKTLTDYQKSGQPGKRTTIFIGMETLIKKGYIGGLDEKKQETTPKDNPS